MKINDTPILMGTSGYKYDDWVGTFYPARISNEEMLPYYIKESGLRFIELTFTFYAIPAKEDIQLILDKAGDELMFSVRLHKKFMKGKFEEAEAFKEAISPLADAGRLKAYLADFHPTFGPSQENLHLIKNMLKTFDQAPLFLDLSNRGWYKERYIDEVKEIGAGICIVDKKGLPVHPVISPGNLSYVRLYGQSGDIGHKHTVQELNKVYRAMDKVSLVSKEIYVSFCNVGQASAIKSAKQMSAIIKSKES